MVEYINAKTKVKIICKKHGIFKQTPDSHLHTLGCRICKLSKGERELHYLLVNNKIEHIREKKFVQCKDKRALPFDFYLPEHKICIEYDGIQHFKIIDFFGEESFKQTQKHDEIKNEFCKKNGIKLIRIKYDENIEEKIKFLL